MGCPGTRRLLSVSVLDNAACRWGAGGRGGWTAVPWRGALRAGSRQGEEEGAAAVGQGQCPGTATLCSPDSILLQASIFLQAS